MTVIFAVKMDEVKFYAIEMIAFWFSFLNLINKKIIRKDFILKFQLLQ